MKDGYFVLDELDGGLDLLVEMETAPGNGVSEISTCFQRFTLC